MIRKPAASRSRNMTYPFDCVQMANHGTGYDGRGRIWGEVMDWTCRGLGYRSDEDDGNGNSEMFGHDRSPLQRIRSFLVYGNMTRVREESLASIGPSRKPLALDCLGWDSEGLYLLVGDCNSLSNARLLTLHSLLFSGPTTPTPESMHYAVVVPQSPHLARRKGRESFSDHLQPQPHKAPSPINREKEEELSPLTPPTRTPTAERQNES
ncbi:hypothetical protein DY000_02020948 [Brassica cretica]|uniref:Uncharacterized protein n=1 Tax=Brassica cretica TaxID=69181 RepID=A0ABQ7EA72_BRACR|nr:hypothetical protein DY000_02020948 [Brassica cretica]